VKVGLVVLNWNNAPDTVACVASIARLEGQFILAVVDNGSSDGSDEVIESEVRGTWHRGRVIGIGDPDPGDEGSHVVVVRTGRNGGYAFGNNRGIETLLSLGVDLVWILNNDTEVAEDALVRILDYVGQKPGPFVAGTLILDWGHPDTIECVGGATYRWPTSRSSWIGRGAARSTAHVRRVDYISGASMLISRSAVQRIGLLDESLFLYFEEVDYAQRATELGVPLVVCDRAVIWHKGGQTTGGRQPWRRRSATAIRNSCRSAVIVTRKHRRFLTPAVVATRLGFAGSLALFGSKRQAVAAVVGIWQGVRVAIARQSR
jgi:GT2 family glycosyltransferase